MLHGKFVASFADVESHLESDNVQWIIQNNNTVNVEHLAGLVEHILLDELSIPRESLPDVQLVLSLPSSIVYYQLAIRSKILQRLACILPQGVFVVESACLAALGSGHGTSLVVNFGDAGVEISAVTDFCLAPSATLFFSQHALSLQRALAAKFIACLDSMCDGQEQLKLTPELTDGLARCPVATIQTILKALPSYKEDDEFVTFNDGKCCIAVSILDDCLKSIFSADAELAFFDVMQSVLMACDLDRRPIILNHVILTGDLMNSKFMCTWFKRQIATSKILSVSDFPGEGQASSVTFKTIADFYQDSTETAVGCLIWFGAALTGKYAFADSRTFLNIKSSTASGTSGSN